MIVETQHPVAVNSIDHQVPLGTRNDNSTSPEFIADVEAYFLDARVPILDLGCSGGQLAIDFYERGHDSYGIEGSDYSIHARRANWPRYHNDRLFTADLSKPLRLLDDSGTPKIFSLIMAWEVIEHFPLDQLPQFFTTIAAHLGIWPAVFVGTVSTVDCHWHGVNHHQSVFPESEWFGRILPDLLRGTGLEVVGYPFRSRVRHDHGSFPLALAKF